MVHLHDHLAGCHLRVGQGLLEAVDRASGHAGRVHLLDPVRGGRGGEHRLDVALEVVGVLQPVARLRVARVGQPLGLVADLVAEGLPQLLVAGAHRGVAVLRAIGLVGGGAAVARAGGRGDLAGAGPGAEFPDAPGEPRLEQRGLQVLALAAAQPADVGAEDAVQRGDAAGDVVHRDADLGWPPARVAGHHHDAGHALRDDVVAAALAVGAGLAEARHRRVDQAGVGLREAVVVDAQALDHAGPEVLHHDVGAGGQLQERLLAARVLQVERHAALVAVEHREAVGLVVDLRVEAARGVAVGEALDLDHVGAQIPEHHRAVGAGHHAGEVDHLHAFERQ